MSGIKITILEPTIVRVTEPGLPGPPGAGLFVALGDTPSSYTGAGGYFVRVSQSMGGLEFRSPADTRADLGLSAVATSGSASDLTTGSLSLARLAQGGAAIGQVLKWNGTQWAPGTDLTGGSGGGGGASTFVELTDTPSAYTGAGNYFVRVTAAADGLQFRAPADVRADIGAAASSHTHDAGDIASGTLSISRGGTGASTASAALSALGGAPATRQVSTGAGLTGGGDLSADRTLALTGQALALHNLATNGLIARTGSGTVASRSIVAGANISVTNGDGVSGNPTIAVTGLASVATSGSASDLTTGALSLQRLAQGGATTGQVLKWNGTQWAPGTDNVGEGGGGASTFVDLTDTPANYSGAGGYFVRVTATSDGLQFRAPADVRADIGAAAASHTHDAGDIASGTLPISRGGTGAGTASAALSNLGGAPATRQISTGTGLTGGGDLSADRSLALTGQALALHNLATNGIIVRTGSGTVASRSLSAGANISVTNADGVSGNPTIAVTGLSAVATSGSASDLTSGALSLQRLAQGGATTGQVLKWNGTQWAPGTDESGGGTFVNLTDTPSAYTGAGGYFVRVTTTADALQFRAPSDVRADIGAAAASHTHDANDIASGTLSIARGGTGAGTASAALGNLGGVPTTRQISTGTGLTGGGDLSANRTIALSWSGANTVPVRNDANDAIEFRPKKASVSIFLPATDNVGQADTNGQLMLWPNVPTRLSAVRARTLGGTCNVQIFRNGTAINGFASAVSLSTTVTNTASTQTLAQDDRISVAITGASSLTGVFLTFIGTETGA